MTFKSLSIMAFVTVSLMGCVAANEPEKKPTPEQTAELEKARADLLAAECALYQKTSVLPDECKQN